MIKCSKAALSSRTRSIGSAAGTVGLAISAAAAMLGCGPEPEHHTISEPLILYSDEGVGVLPRGSTLVFQRSMPEGFERFSVMINVEGARLPTAPPARPGLIDPLSTYPGPPATGSSRFVTDDDLVAILRSLEVTREDLERIAPRLE